MMNATPTFCAELAPSGEAIAIHLLRALTTAQREDRRLDLDELVSEVGARRAEVRRTLSALHRGGYVDVLRMRLTLKGFAIGQALSATDLIPLRARAAATRAA